MPDQKMLVFIVLKGGDERGLVGQDMSPEIPLSKPEYGIRLEICKEGDMSTK